MDNATLFTEISLLPDHLKEEVADFVGFLKEKLKKSTSIKKKNEMPAAKKVSFTVIHVDNKDYKFDRNEANER